MRGVIKRMVKEKGYGFILGDDGKDVFFHASSMNKGLFETLADGAAVEYDTEQGPKGLRAKEVKIGAA